mmetsp:Transcript_57701/g.93381  ORF Transcript_57701/g.93381 Transcript_57701/m.93381 type:complete len:312 (+) Transcript_57701:642-1577(+)
MYPETWCDTTWERVLRTKAPLPLEGATNSGGCREERKSACALSRKRGLWSATRMARIMRARSRMSKSMSYRPMSSTYRKSFSQVAGSERKSLVAKLRTWSLTCASSVLNVLASSRSASGAILGTRWWYAPIIHTTDARASGAWMVSMSRASCRTILTRASGACCTRARTTTTLSATMSWRFDVWISCMRPRTQESVSAGIHAATRPMAWMVAAMSTASRDASLMYALNSRMINWAFASLTSWERISSLRSAEHVQSCARRKNSFAVPSNMSGRVWTRVEILARTRYWVSRLFFSTRTSDLPPFTTWARGAR